MNILKKTKKALLTLLSFGLINAIAAYSYNACAGQTEARPVYEDIYRDVMRREAEKRARPGWLFVPGSDFYDRVEAIADEEYNRRQTAYARQRFTDNRQPFSGEARMVNQRGPLITGDAKVIGNVLVTGEVKVITRGERPLAYGEAKGYGKTKGFPTRCLLSIQKRLKDYFAF